MNLLLFFFLVQSRTYICTPKVGTSQVVWDVNIVSKDCVTAERIVTGIQMHIHAAPYLLLSLTPHFSPLLPFHLELGRQDSPKIRAELT